MKKSAVVIFALIAFLWLGSRAQAARIPRYTIVSVRDVSFRTPSFRDIVRKTYRVRVTHTLSKEELSALSYRIVDQATQRNPYIKAIMIFFYLPNTDINGGYTAGRAIWAPGGDWGNADSYLLSPKFTLTTATPVTTTGSIIRRGGFWMPKKDIVRLPLKEKMRIFYQITRYQDLGIGDRKAYVVAAKKFHITVKQAYNIVEGSLKSWPMPPPLK